MPYCQKCGAELSEEDKFCPNCRNPTETTEKTKALNLAYWGERFVAWLIDVIILGVIAIPIKWFWTTFWPTYTIPGFPGWIPFTDFGMNNVIYFLYWLLMDGIYGQSLGKMLLRIKITNMNENPVNMGQAAIESVGKAFLLPLDCLLGWILYPRKRQRLFNYLSETIVVKA